MVFYHIPHVLRVDIIILLCDDMDDHNYRQVIFMYCDSC